MMFPFVHALDARGSGAPAWYRGHVDLLSLGALTAGQAIGVALPHFLVEV
jgi:hypothetical protein